MSVLFRTPDVDRTDREVIAEIHGMKRELAQSLRTPRRWHGGLRRTTQARAVRGSNTIEGYTVTPGDALAAVDDEAPLTADQQTWAEIKAYQRVLTYVLQVATLPGFRVDTQTLRTMHFMLLEHELAKSPGAYRSSEIYVRDDREERNVYRGPEPELVPDLMEALAVSLETPSVDEPMVRAAMAHLNLVMIHPFRDGNGRMARVVQTLVLARDKVTTPEFSSIEEWLGSNTDDYYRVLAVTGQGAWHPEHDAHLWLRFNLRAHHMQAQTLRRRFREASATWQALDELQRRSHLLDRDLDVLFDAYLGGRITRTAVTERASIDASTATRDLKRLAEQGLLEGRGETRGRHFVAGPALRELREQALAGRQPIGDPYPELVTDLRRGPVVEAAPLF